AEQAMGPAATSKKDYWPKSAKIFRTALNETLCNQGKDCDPFGDGLMKVKAVPTLAVRKEVCARYPSARGDAAKQKDAKRNAFNRAMRLVMARDLVGAREIDGIEHIWLPAAQT